MRIREIDPEEDGGRSIDNVMLSWQKQTASEWEKDLRKKLGGPERSAPSFVGSIGRAESEAPVAAPVPPPIETQAPGKVLAVHDPWAPTHAPAPNGNGSTHRAPEPPSKPDLERDVAPLVEVRAASPRSLDPMEQADASLQAISAAQRAVGHRATTKKGRRSTKQWKKGSKARRR